MIMKFRIEQLTTYEARITAISEQQALQLIEEHLPRPRIETAGGGVSTSYFIDPADCKVLQIIPMNGD